MNIRVDILQSIRYVNTTPAAAHLLRNDTRRYTVKADNASPFGQTVIQSTPRP